MVWTTHGGSSGGWRLDPYNGSVYGGGARHLFDETPSHWEATTGDVLRVTVSHVLYPVTEGVLHQVFYAYGAEQVVVLERAGHVEALVRFRSSRDAEWARDVTHGRCVYDGCCWLDVQHMQPTPSDSIGETPATCSTLGLSHNTNVSSMAATTSPATTLTTSTTSAATIMTSVVTGAQEAPSDELKELAPKETSEEPKKTVQELCEMILATLNSMIEGGRDINLDTTSNVVELLQVPIEDDGCGQQPGFITQPTELDDVSDHSCELTHSVEAYSWDNIVLQNKISNIVSPLDLIDEVSNHQKPSNDITNSDVDKSSVGNEYLVCCVNQSCDDHIDNNEYWYPRVVQGSLESVKIVEEFSPIDEFNTEMGSPLVVMQSDLCGSIERTYTSLEEVVPMQAEGQFDSLVCHGVRSKDILLHLDVEQAANDYNFAFDKTLDLAQTTNFVTQDGRLESIVYDALKSHAQRKNSENKTFVGVPDTAVIPSPPVDGFTDNCPKANSSHDGQILFPNDTEWSSKDMSQSNATMDFDISNSVKDQGSREQFVFQPQLFQACVDRDETVAACLDKVFSSRYGASLLPSYGAFIQAGLLTNSKSIRQLACKAVLHLLDKAGDSAAAVETFVQHSLYPLLINYLIEGDEEISAIVLDAIKHLAEIPKGTDIIFPPDGQGSVQLDKVAAQSSSMARIRILSLVAKLFTVSNGIATAIRDSNLLSLFEDEIKDRRDMLKTLSALEVLYELVEHPYSNIFLLKTNLLQLIIDVDLSSPKPSRYILLADGALRESPRRSAGVAVPMFSIRSDEDLGVGEFLDLKLLVDCAVNWGFHLVQLLPINDTSVHGMWRDSYPYSLLLVFALQPLYLRVQAFSEAIPGDVKEEILQAKKQLDKKDVDYEATMAMKLAIARKIFNLEKRQGWDIVDKLMWQYTIHPRVYSGLFGMYHVWGESSSTTYDILHEDQMDADNRIAKLMVELFRSRDCCSTLGMEDLLVPWDPGGNGDYSFVSAWGQAEI